MNLRLGYAVSSKSKNPEVLVEKIRAIFKYQNDVIEISLTRESKLQHEYTPELIKLINKFKYKSLHAPVVDKDLNRINYPSKKGNELLGKINDIIAKIKPKVLLFHPDCVTDFKWLNKRYKDLLAFENMDEEKLFGKTIKDLKEVFHQCPNAKWVFDLNHLYTNDKTMKSSKDFYNAFSDRLCHYHLSSYGGFHDCFCRTHEDIILSGLTDLSKPIVHEGDVVEKGLLEEESEYIKQRIFHEG